MQSTQEREFGRNDKGSEGGSRTWKNIGERYIYYLFGMLECTMLWTQKRAEEKQLLVPRESYELLKHVTNILV